MSGAAAAKRRLLALLRRFGFSRVLGLSLLLPLLALRVWDPAPLEILRLKIFDLYQIAQPREPTMQPAIIVDIDEESLAEIGQWPWPRTEVARMVAQLREAGAVAIAFDVVFAEPDRTSPALYAESLGGLEPEVAAALRALPSNDEVLARELAQTRLVLGQSGYHRNVTGKESAPQPKVPLATIGGDPRPYLFRFPALVRNTPVLDEAAPGRAVFNLVPGSDGVVRRVPAFVVAAGEIVPSLTVELLRLATGGNAFAIKTNEAGISAFVVGGVEVPTDRHGRLWMYYAKSRPELYVSARELLAGSVPTERLAGKLVLIGTSAAGLFDIKATPLQDRVPGVEVHAQMLEMILSGQLLLRPNYALGAELLMLAAVALTMIALVPVLGAALTLLLGALVAAALWTASWFLFTGEGLLIDVAYPLIGSFAVFTLLVFTNYLREEGRRQRVRSAFRQYLSPTLVDQLANEPDRLVLGGESREMTVLFSDVRGFTSISERLQDRPQELTRLMNRLLTPLTAEIMENNGTIDKYMGDAVMAFWNAPLPDADHVFNACKAALAMLEALERLNEALVQEAREAGGGEAMCMNVGIGINTGTCVVGNMGSEQRFDYSVLGDAVNLASRLEGQCKTYGASIILGEATAAVLGTEGVLVELDMIRVKGKREPQRIFALLGGAALPDAPALMDGNDVRATTGGIAEVLAAYRAQDWDRALQMIDGLAGRRLALLDLDVFLPMYRRRIENFRRRPPPADWDGVFTAETK
ncbi:adenylate/guanylate cyclase domain-containing protein [Pelagibius litoralis]|uniref:Adenylate/guanylate cyclase domain-containing protein n=1 Tax=Pelagibius litoralis TaxID=374515 RepID=A0A967EYY4_9PROT|nr:adenylate/guanylate cyclase domain-containing protein [Pelagibius litoralis]